MAEGDRGPRVGVETSWEGRQAVGLWSCVEMWNSGSLGQLWPGWLVAGPALSNLLAYCGLKGAAGPTSIGP